MEPVKGGNLVNLPDDAKKIFDNLNGGSYASYAIRFAAGFDNVFMVLSGMSTFEQMQDNLSYMKDFKPLDEKEQEAVKKVCEVFKACILFLAPHADTAWTVAQNVFLSPTCFPALTQKTCIRIGTRIGITTKFTPKVTAKRRTASSAANVREFVRNISK